MLINDNSRSQTKLPEGNVFTLVSDPVRREECGEGDKHGRCKEGGGEVHTWQRGGMCGELGGGAGMVKEACVMNGSMCGEEAMHGKGEACMVKGGMCGEDGVCMAKGRHAW